MGSNVFGTGVTNWCIRDDNEIFHVLWNGVISSRDTIVLSDGCKLT